MYVRITKGFYEDGELVEPSERPVKVSAQEGARLIDGRVAVLVRDLPMERAIVPPAPERTEAPLATEAAVAPEAEVETAEIAEPTTEPIPEPAPAPKRRGRPRKQGTA